MCSITGQTYKTDILSRITDLEEDLNDLFCFYKQLPSITRKFDDMV